MSCLYFSPPTRPHLDHMAESVSRCGCRGLGWCWATPPLPVLLGCEPPAGPREWAVCCRQLVSVRTVGSVAAAAVAHCTTSPGGEWTSGLSVPCPGGSSLVPARSTTPSRLSGSVRARSEAKQSLRRAGPIVSHPMSITNSALVTKLREFWQLLRLLYSFY